MSLVTLGLYILLQLDFFLYWSDPSYRGAVPENNSLDNQAIFILALTSTIFLLLFNWRSFGKVTLWIKRQ
jgi:hypothetical protein